jgi:hypothetical protein
MELPGIKELRNEMKATVQQVMEMDKKMLAAMEKNLKEYIDKKIGDLKKANNLK